MSGTLENLIDDRHGLRASIKLEKVGRDPPHAIKRVAVVRPKPGFPECQGFRVVFEGLGVVIKKTVLESEGVHGLERVGMVWARFDLLERE
jgi:hypothetical protein